MTYREIGPPMMILLHPSTAELVEQPKFARWLFLGKLPNVDPRNALPYSYQSICCPRCLAYDASLMPHWCFGQEAPLNSRIAVVTLRCDAWHDGNGNYFFVYIGRCHDCRLALWAVHGENEPSLEANLLRRA